MTRVLVVDDEPQILRALTINLRARHYDVVAAPDGETALAAAADQQPDVVLLDLGLPDMDGLQVIEGLRGWTTAPIIVLSGRADSTDKIEALDAGADDYVTKPFSMGELLARMRATERRAVSPAEPRVEFGPLIVDLAAHSIIHAKPNGAAADGKAGSDGHSGADGDPIRLTPTEWHLLEILLRNPGKLVSQRQLLTEAWGPAYTKESHYLRLYMARLRRKLEPDPSRPQYLLTEPGMGYRFQP